MRDIRSNEMYVLYFYDALYLEHDVSLCVPISSWFIVTLYFKVGVTVTAPSRRPVTSRVLDVVERPGVYRIEFTPEEVGTHLIDVSRTLVGNLNLLNLQCTWMLHL